MSRTSFLQNWCKPFSIVLSGKMIQRAALVEFCLSQNSVTLLKKECEMKQKGIKLYKDGAQVSASVEITFFEGYAQKNEKLIYLDDFPVLVLLDLDPTDVVVTHTESDDDDGSLRIWKNVEGDLLEWRLCSQCQRHYLAEAGRKTSYCGPTCRQSLTRPLRQKKHAKEMANAEEEATKSLTAFVGNVCQHNCKNQSALDNHILLNHPTQKNKTGAPLF
jgi:hypothetical protein